MTINRGKPSNRSAKVRSAAGVAPTPNTHRERRRRPIDIAEVVTLLLDKGVALDSYLQGAAIGLEVWTIDTRMTIASLDSYLRYGDSANPADPADPADR